MQTKTIIKWVLLNAIAAVLVSCGKTNTQGRLIPLQAGIVIQLNGESLSSKLPWEEIKQNPLFQQAYSDSSLPASVRSFLDNPENAGVDIKTDFMFFSIKDSLGGYIAFEGIVKDEAKFKSFNQQATENGTESEQNGIQFISKSPVCIGWSKEKFVYLVDIPQMAQMDELSRRMMRDSIEIDQPSPRDISATCKAIFELKEDNSLAKNDRFTALMKEKGDVHFWMNVEELYKSSGATNAMAMINLEKFYKGNVTTGTMDFDNGKISVNTKSYAGDELTSLFKKYAGGKINEEMLKRIPGKDVVGVMALNFKPEGLHELIKLTGMDGLINIGISSLGFTMDDFIKANKGDIVVGISDLSLKTDTASFQFPEQDKNTAINQKPEFNYIFSASIGDKDAFNKILNAGKKMGETSLQDSANLPLAYNSNGTYFALGNTRGNVDHFLSTATTNFDFISKISGEPFGGYLNIQSLLKSFGAVAQKDSSSKIAYDASLKMWETVYWKGGNFSDGGILQKIEVNLVDKSTNSLKQLNQYMAQFAALHKENRERKKREMADFENAFPGPVTDSLVSIGSQQ